MAAWRILLILALAVAGLLGTDVGSGKAGQVATPAPLAQEVADSYLGGAWREFEAGTLRLAGTMALRVTVFVFDDAAVAARAFPSTAGSMRDQMGERGEALRPASPADVGDEALAWVGDVPADDGSAMTFSLGIFAWREGPAIYVAYGGGFMGDPLPDLFAVGRAIEGRRFVAGPVATPAGSAQMHTGGVWDLLPTLADVPEGLVFADEGLAE